MKKRLILSCRLTEDGKEARLRLPDEDALFRGDTGSFSISAAHTAAVLSFAAPDAGMLERDLTALGFDSMSVIGADCSDSERIGMAVGERRGGGAIRTLIVLFPTQGAQWYSNFRVGYSAEHSGFGRAADFAEDHLCRLISGCRGESQRSFFVTGYSRGGAVANILARRLCDRYGSDNVRGYTFASPNTAIPPKGADYRSIFNLIRREDFFASLPLSEWGYRRYGSDIVLSGDIRRGFRRLCGSEYIGFFGSEELDAVLKAVYRLAPNVHAYYARRYPIGERRLSLYEYMNGLAAVLAQDGCADDIAIIADGMASEFADLSSFMATGADIGALLSGAQGIPRCSVADSHSAGAYLASIEAMCGQRNPSALTAPA